MSRKKEDVQHRVTQSELLKGCDAAITSTYSGHGWQRARSFIKQPLVTHVECVIVNVCKAVQCHQNEDQFACSALILADSCPQSGDVLRWVLWLRIRLRPWEPQTKLDADSLSRPKIELNPATDAFQLSSTSMSRSHVLRTTCLRHDQQVHTRLL